MSYMVKVKCNVSDAIFELPPLRNNLASAFVTQGNFVKERYDEIYDYLREHGLEASEMLSYNNVHSLFKVYVHKALINEAVERIFDLERNEFNMLEVLSDLVSDRKLREYVYGEPMVRAFAHAIRTLPNGDSVEAVSHGSTILILEKKFLNDRKI
ncbi:MAG: hypothetical protein IKK84_04460 [Clostridia bacterium]|nr:hypothetical protein [Clostridia bacterium]